MTHPIIIAACERHGIAVECFSGKGRSEKLMACRAEAVQDLRRKGFSWKGIAQLAGRSVQSVEYWSCPASREKHNAYQRERWNEVYKTADMVRRGVI